MRDPAEAARLGEEGHRRAIAAASWSEVATQIATVYDALLAARASTLSG